MALLPLPRRGGGRERKCLPVSCSNPAIRCDSVQYCSRPGDVRAMCKRDNGPHSCSERGGGSLCRLNNDITVLPPSCSVFSCGGSHLPSPSGSLHASLSFCFSRGFDRCSLDYSATAVSVSLWPGGVPFASLPSPASPACIFPRCPSVSFFVLPEQLLTDWLPAGARRRGAQASAAARQAGWLARTGAQKSQCVK